MRRLLIVAMVMVCLALPVRGAGLAGYLPANMDVTYQLLHVDSQPAWQEILNLYRDKLANQNDPNMLLLSYIFKQFKFREIAGGYNRAAQQNNNVLLVQPQLSGPGEQFNRFLIDNLGSFVAIDQNWHQTAEGEAKIYFDIRGEANEKLTSFNVANDQVILASNSALVKKCLAAGEKQANIESQSWYKALRDKALANYDGVGGINNRNRNFTAELKKWEKNNNLVVLMSSDWIDALGLSFRFLSDDRIQGRLLFQCSEPGKVALVKSDAEFLGEVAKRRYSASQLGIKSKVTVNGNVVILDFEAVNWRPILEKELN